ncbi:MAG: hypothetical protein ASARMPREDX12_004220 [Alectoria sarmentosa]|nr:MAG: hypothetical protein ASARMPREDX12_004220 [Alectoria sarmentosa]CAD6590202.1 MAG: hypothetical protein ASARMPRED_004669 [Alectoria sarmentosa]
MLPPEVLSLVCGFLSKQVLKQVRQISKTWEQAAVPYLFDEIFISQNMADFRIAKLTILQFKHYIHTLVFSSVYYTYIDRESFDEAFDVDTDIRHSEHAFTLYRIARKNQQENLTNGSPSAYLSFALTSSPNIRKIILTDTSSSRSMSHQSLQTYEPRSSKACPVKQCDLKDTGHFPHEVCESGFSRKGSNNPWRLVLQALSATNANVKELTMEPGNLELSTDTAAFSMSPGSLSQAKLCFRTLTKIRFSLIMDSERFSTSVDKHHVHRNIAKLLSSAVSLECLSLDLDETAVRKTEFSTLQEILGLCKFPKLKTLILAFLTSSEMELLRLLKYSRNLEQLTIECHNLTEGSWMRIADWIRASLPRLRYAELNQLYGGFDGPWEDVEYRDFYEHVSDFLFAQGENPFTTKALEKYHADRKAEREMVNSNGGIGFIEAYRKYH